MSDKDKVNPWLARWAKEMLQHGFVDPLTAPVREWERELLQEGLVEPLNAPLDEWERELLDLKPPWPPRPTTERNDMATDDEPATAPTVAVPMPPGTEVVRIEIVDRRTGTPATIERLMLLPQRILLVQSLLDSLAGVSAPLTGNVSGDVLAARMHGVWVCEFGRKHHCDDDRMLDGVDRGRSIQHCFDEWSKVFTQTHGRTPKAADAYPWYAAHVPFYSMNSRHNWQEFTNW